MALLSKVQVGQPITAEIFNNMIDAIRECQLNSVVGSGGTTATFKRGPGGTTISINSVSKQQGSQQDQCPFAMTTVVSGSGLYVNVGYGLINGIFVRDTNKNLSAVSGSTNYICIDCVTNGKSITSAGIVVQQTIPDAPLATADTAPSSFKVVIGVVTNGLAYRAIGCDNVTARVSPSIQENATTYSAGQRNFTQYYQWVI